MQFSMDLSSFRSLFSSLPRMDMSFVNSFSVLGNILIDVMPGEGVLTVTYTDSETFFRAYTYDVASFDTPEDYTFLLPLILFKKLPTSGLAHFKAEDGRLSITVDDSMVFEKNLFPSENFPRFPMKSGASDYLSDSYDTSYLIQNEEKLIESIRSIVPMTKRTVVTQALEQVWVRDGFLESGDGEVFHRIHVGSHVNDVRIPMGAVKSLLRFIDECRSDDLPVLLKFSDPFLIVSSGRKSLAFRANTFLNPDITPKFSTSKVFSTESFKVDFSALGKAASAVSLAHTSTITLSTTDAIDRLAATCKDRDTTYSATLFVPFEYVGPQFSLVTTQGALEAFLACTPKSDTIFFGRQTMFVPAEDGSESVLFLDSTSEVRV